LYDGAYVTGISGGLLAACLSNGIACKGLVISTSANIPDPDSIPIAIVTAHLIETVTNSTIKIRITFGAL